MLPLLGVGEASRSFGRERGEGPLRMFARAPAILGVVAVFGLYEASLMAMLPIWGVRSGLTSDGPRRRCPACISGRSLFQVMIGWLSDRVSRLTALRLCGAVGVVGAVALVTMPPVPLLCSVCCSCGAA